MPLSARSDDGSTTPSRTSGIHHSNVLYYFLQKKYLPAISKSLFFKKTERYNPEKHDGNLLLGALYLSYGLYNDAKKLFIIVADNSDQPALRDKAWLYLSEIFYRRGEYNNAHSALNRIKQTLPSTFEARKIILNANIFLAQNKYEKAVELLRNIKEKETIWTHYARFNLGVALIKLQQKKQGIEVIETITNNKKHLHPEAAALRDRANIALGYTALNNQQTTSARRYFEQVHLHGPYSNQALFGLGQAWLIEQQPSKAIHTWKELNNRNNHGAAVLESSLAIAKAYIAEKKHSQALIYLNKAINTIDADVTLLQQTIIDIDSNHLMNEILLDKIELDKTPWQWDPGKLPKALKRYAIAKLVSSHDFIEALKSYRDLEYINKQFKTWKNSISAFSTMLNTRRHGYNNKLPLTLKKYKSLGIAEMNIRYNNLAKELQRIENKNDLLALKTAEEATSLKRSTEVNSRLVKIGSFLSPEKIQNYQERARRTQGLLYWKIANNYKPRLHVTKKYLQELAFEIEEATYLRTELDKAQQREPALFEHYQNRISELRKRVNHMEIESEKLIAAQRKQIESAATVQLNKQIKRLTHYKEQAQYAIAQIYDLALTTKSNEEN
ncbi:MAG: tetratricopeptide repeat protein [Gammaproteobacteria bacterium]|nr:tetratricopeptide repeat protein [Gammaproteobacteria bacterium]